MAGSLISGLGQMVALSSGGNRKKNLGSLIDHGGTAALCLSILLRIFSCVSQKWTSSLFELLLFYSFSYFFGTAFDRMRFHLNDAKRLGVMEDWWVIEMNTGNNVRNPEKLLILTKKNDTIPTELYKVEILRKNTTQCFARTVFHLMQLLVLEQNF